MSWKRKIWQLVPIALLALVPSLAGAQTIFADKVLDHSPSGTGPMQEPYGGDVRVSDRPYPLKGTGHAIDKDRDTFISLPKGASITVAFTTGVIFDGPNDDLFIAEVGAASELADVFISTDFGKSFVRLGTADGGKVTRLDLRTINFDGKVNAVKIVGLDTKGLSPGFDVAYVEGLEGSIQSVTPEEGNSPSGSLADLIGETGSAPLSKTPAPENPAPAPEKTPPKPADGAGGGSLMDLINRTE